MYSPEKNRVFHSRVKALAVAVQCLREEAARLLEWRATEIVPGGTPSEYYADTDTATRAEVEALVTACADFVDLKAAVHAGALVPFLADSPARA